jgi:hypothetical protein
MKAKKTSPTTAAADAYYVVTNESSNSNSNSNKTITRRTNDRNNDRRRLNRNRNHHGQNVFSVIDMIENLARTKLKSFEAFIGSGKTETDAATATELSSAPAKKQRRRTNDDNNEHDHNRYREQTIMASVTEEHNRNSRRNNNTNDKGVPTVTTKTTTKNNRNNNSISNISNGASSKKRVVDEIITITNKSKLTQKEQIRKRLWAGTMSTICVRTLLAPLERLKTEYLFNRSKDALFQTAKIVFKNEGVIGFWKGNFVNICRTAPFKAINFSAFDTYRTAIKKTFDVKENTALDEISLLISGAFACGTAVTICYPMDVVRTRLVVKGGKEKYKNIVSCVRILYREEGLASFYRGILPAMAQMTPNAAVYYSVYNSLKQYRLTEMKKEADEIKTQRLMRTTPGDSNTKLKNNEKKLSVAAAAKSSTTKEENDLVPRTIEPQFMMLFGMLAGVASESFTFPLEVARRQIQMNTGRVCAKDILGSKEMKMMLEVTRKVLKENGFAGLYKGLTPTIMQVLPSAAMGYYCYESFKLVAGVD